MLAPTVAYVDNKIYMHIYLVMFLRGSLDSLTLLPTLKRSKAVRTGSREGARWGEGGWWKVLE